MKTPVVALGLVAENINRIVNVYRPFYYIKTGQRVTKPRFRLVDGKLDLVPNPVPAEEFLSRLRDPSFIEKIGRDDYWYNRNDYPVFRFPYSLIPEMVSLWQQGYEVVYTNKKSQQLSGLTGLQVKLFYRVISKISGLRLTFGQSDFRLMDRKVLDAILDIPEYRKFLRGMVHWLRRNAEASPGISTGTFGCRKRRISRMPPLILA